MLWGPGSGHAYRVADVPSHYSDYIYIYTMYVLYNAHLMIECIKTVLSGDLSTSATLKCDVHLLPGPRSHASHMLFGPCSSRAGRSSLMLWYTG